MGSARVGPWGVWPFGWAVDGALDPTAAMDWCLETGQAGVSVKVMNRAREDGRETLRSRELAWLDRTLEVFRPAGLFVVPWGYFSALDVERQAAKFGGLLEERGLAFCGVNVEIDSRYEGTRLWRGIKGKRLARLFVQSFRSNGGVNVWAMLSTFAQERLHGDFPYSGFLGAETSNDDPLDAFGPQCYGSWPAKQLEEAAATAAKFGVGLVPALRAYREDGMKDVARIARNLYDLSDQMANWRGGQIESWNYWRWESARDRPEFMAPIAEAGLGVWAVEAEDPVVDPGIERVKRLQVFLNLEGWGLGLKVDGIYGPKTEAALRALLRSLSVSMIAAPDLEKIGALAATYTADAERLGGALREFVETLSG